LGVVQIRKQYSSSKAAMRACVPLLIFEALAFQDGFEVLTLAEVSHELGIFSNGFAGCGAVAETLEGFLHPSPDCEIHMGIPIVSKL
jgi:hypothetical protein